MYGQEKKLGLEDLLAFRNWNVIKSFCAAFAIPQGEAEIIFEDMLRFFWLCEAHGDRELRMIDSPLLIIDEMWHLFILHTKDYSEFCMKHFGHYMHHNPTSVDEKIAERAAFANPASRESLIEKKRNRYTQIYDIFDKTVFARWFIEYPEKYSKKQINSLRVV